MSEYQPDPVDDVAVVTNTLPPLSTEEISQLLLAASLAATEPLLGLIKFLIQEGILNGDKFKSFLEPILVDQKFPAATGAMLNPIWKSLIGQIDKLNEAMRPNEDGHRND